MVRRKASTPRAGLGRVEDRGATPEPAPEAEASAAGSLCSDWEEGTAHRRVRSRHVPPHLKEYAVTLHVGAGERELGLLPWSLGGAGDVALRLTGASTAAVLQPLVDSAQEDDSTAARFPRVMLRLPDEQTLAVLAPSDEAASSLHVLLRTEMGHLAWHADSLTLCLSSLALSQQATHAEEWTQRQWQRSLLVVLAEFCPGVLGKDAAESTTKAPPPHSPRTSAPACPPSPEPPLSPPPRQQHNHAAEIARVYRLTAPTGLEPAYEQVVPGLVPTLRGYQRRALQWMLGREHGWHAERVKKEEADEKEEASASPQLHILWRKLSVQNCSAPLYINAYTGLLSERAFPAPAPVRGGILADEMGLGKTVELLALILAHRYAGPPPQFSRPAIVPEERVECPCGALAEDGAFAGLWVQCESCLAWAHAPCVGFRAAEAEAPWACARCLAARAEVRSSRPCGATLVVCPAAIAEQWAEEARRHVEADRVLIRFFGGQGGGAHGGEVITAEDLACCDVVVTTYDVLRRDVHRVGEEAGEEREDWNEASSKLSAPRSRSRRRPPKYSTPATPLTRLVWWRVCLDEAQTVEGASSAAAELAGRLRCTHRWCVSGTPLARGVEDAGGLLRFLRAAPWDDRRWWSRCVAGPLSAAEDGGGRGQEHGRRSPRNRALSLVVSLLRPPVGLLWRSSKRAVAAELDLPPQSAHTHALSFSALERLFYAKQHAECVAKARAALSSRVLEAALREAVQAREEQELQLAPPAPLALAQERRLLHPLLRLRQACCHPQLGASGLRPASAHAALRAPMTMRQVLGVLLAKARLEAEEGQRLLLAALHGLAGLAALEGRWADAAGLYRESLATQSAHLEPPLQVRADALQQLHAMHNLREVLQAVQQGKEAWSRKEGVGSGSDRATAPAPPAQLRAGRTLADDSLQERCRAICDAYAAESAAKLADVRRDAERAREDAEGAAKSTADALELDPVAAALLVRSWWADAARLLAACGADERACETVRARLREEEAYSRPGGRGGAEGYSLAARFRSLAGLSALLESELRALEGAQSAALGELEQLQRICQDPAQSLVEQAGTCGRCRGETGVAGRVCPHCRWDERMRLWEVRLFSVSAAGGAGALDAEEVARRAHAASLLRIGRGGLGEEETGDGFGEGPRQVARAEIQRKPSQVETALRALLAALRSQTGALAPRDARRKADLVRAGQAQLEELAQRRALYLKSAALGLAQRGRLYALDELAQCTGRMRWRVGKEKRDALDMLHILEAGEVAGRSVELSNDRAVADMQLREALSTLRYLLLLEQRDRERDQAGGVRENEAGGEGPEAPSSQPATAPASPLAPPNPAGSEDVCPICHDPLRLEFAMLSCGHSTCTKCLVHLEEVCRSRRRRLQCPTCRAFLEESDVAFVDRRHEHLGASKDGQDVRGSYGTKLEAVVSTLRNILASSPDARALVFSTWVDALSLLSHALVINSIPHLHPRGGGQRLAQALREFKRPDSSHRTLLLPVRQGGNGLNLTEAQHVLLIEPLMDAGQEAQAVGRVSRMGQTRPTHVHRFVVRDSIEENLHGLGRARKSGAEARAQARGGVHLTLRDVGLLLAPPQAVIQERDEVGV